ncbi:hypothetical protein [Mixta sp. Marseille-Q2659]|uniref:hypothetical protein n=1 Tax=Mixta sp. Marseille-Q2659 TaxID=2736607 RepID=UPI0023B8B21D|nr:hypothetical protein [Mixta sp. Marseille-Q2659]
MNNQERQALIGFINAEIARIQRKKELLEGDRMRIASHRLSLAALTAEPVKVPDELTMREAIRLKLSVDWAAGYNTAIAHCKELSEPIDNTAQQYEALAGWRIVPVEPSKEMLSQIHPIADGNCSHCGNRTTLDCKENMLLSWRDMLEAAPKPEV